MKNRMICAISALCFASLSANAAVAPNASRLVATCTPKASGALPQTKVQIYKDTFADGAKFRAVVSCAANADHNDSYDVRVYTTGSEELHFDAYAGFNLEVVTNSNLPPGIPLPTGPGYSALAILSADARALTLAQGNYGVVDSGTYASGAGNVIAGGIGFQSIGGAAGDSILGGRGFNEFIDASKGNQSILGGTGDNETIWGGAGDTIFGGIDNATIGGVALRN